MRYKDINTLEQLREKKAELKKDMKRADHKSQNNFIVSTLNRVFEGKKEDSKSVPSALDRSTEQVLSFLATQTRKRIGWKGVVKIAIPLAITAITPFVWKNLKNKKKRTT
jgi:hypothetical protein